MKKTGKIVIFVFLILSMLLVFSSFWVLNTFGNVMVDEILFTMLIPQKGVNFDVIFSFILEVIPGTILTSLVLYFLIVKNYNSDWLNRRFIKFVVVFLIFFISFVFSCNKVNVFDYVISQFTNSNFIEEEYVDARSVSIEFKNNKRNLIYIFLESMESSYTSKANGGVFNVDRIPELSQLASSYISFSSTDKLGGAHVLPGTTWTVGAMVAHTSGLPIKLNVGKRYSSFVNGAYTLGDILKDNGYVQEVMFGSDADFGKRRDYFKDHGDYIIFDLNTAISTGKMEEKDKVWWGFEDSDLFEYAKEEIISLSNMGKPFNFTMLTVDTHFEDGYLSGGCEDKFDDQYSNVIACSSRQVFEFVKWIQEQEFYDNTTIVIAGDHLTMDVDYMDGVNDIYNRTVYNVFINAVVYLENVNYHNRIFSTMDMFPTTLGAMGVVIEDDRLGLGTNLFSQTNTLLEEYGVDVVKSELMKRSSFYEKNIS